MISFTRRAFCKGAMLCSAGAVFAKEMKSPQTDFPTDPRARIAVASYPFRSILISPANHDRDTSKHGMDLAAFARYVRTEFHVRGIEPLSLPFPSTEQDEILELRATFDAVGVHTVNIPVDGSVELCSTKLRRGTRATHAIAAGSISQSRLGRRASASGFRSVPILPICPGRSML